jgi:hypothetical protein
MISYALRNVFCSFLQKEEGKVQGQLNNTDSSQYIRDLKDQIAELKHEVSSYNRGIMNQRNNKHCLYLLFSETILLPIFLMFLLRFVYFEANCRSVNYAHKLPALRVLMYQHTPLSCNSII